jgi:hypothetical protein
MFRLNLLLAVVAAAVPLALAQDHAQKCSTAFLDMAMGGAKTQAEKCEGIATYTACVDAIADGSTEVSATTARSDKLYQSLGCKDSEMIVQPMIRTQRGDLNVQVNADAKFTRHKRETVSIFDLKTTIDSLVGDVTKANAEQQVKNDAVVKALSDTVLKAMTDSSDKGAALEKSLTAKGDTIEQTLTKLVNSATAKVDNQVKTLCSPGNYLKSGKCTPYTVCTSGKTYYTAVGTKDADAKCAPVSTCSTGNTFEAVGPSLFSNRQCKTVTKCASGCTEASKPTLTADRTCKCAAAKFVKPAQTSKTALNSCLEIQKYYESKDRTAQSGLYYVKMGGSTSAIYYTHCDMTRDGGGWTLIGSARGHDQSCWRSDSDCNKAYSHVSSKTWHMSSDNFNRMKYKVIRVEGYSQYSASWGDIGNFQYWKGKGLSGGCTARWNKVHTNGACSRSHRSLDWKYARQGRQHGNHRFVGDWPTGGSNHIVHINGNQWYFQSPHTTRSYSPSCSGGDWRCDMKVWLRE